eukprot:TRINITY_DN88374_c0_g2_i2.p2 TRINITY_DN88374_c0_g2~~TRINITY_DN88374_c0_g2_i2.p2  ORF type:complete len:51 (+),score=9.92 TRINITY_DN88374_c0_g2_i2:2-154(+)
MSSTTCTEKTSLLEDKVGVTKKSHRRIDSDDEGFGKKEVDDTLEQYKLHS